MRVSFVVVCLGLAALVAGCDDTPVPTPTPTPGTSVSASAYVLRGSPVAAYQRTSNVAVSAAALAAKVPDATMPKQLQQQGYQTGAQATFAQPTPPTNVVTPFADVQSSAYLFNDAAGATAFFNGESQRIDQEANGGVVTPIANPPKDNVDALLALQEVNPGAAPGAPQNRAYIALGRRGRVVIELFARININKTTVNDFLPLLASQESNLATPPD